MLTCLLPCNVDSNTFDLMAEIELRINKSDLYRITRGLPSSHTAEVVRDFAKQLVTLALNADLESCGSNDELIESIQYLHGVLEIKISYLYDESTAQGKLFDPLAECVGSDLARFIAVNHAGRFSLEDLADLARHKHVQVFLSLVQIAGDAIDEMILNLESEK